MTSLDEALRALEKKWRDESNRRQESAGEMENDEPQDAAWNSGIAAGLDECADELAALLSSRQEVAPVAYCDPADPRNSHAFAWPGTDREERHATPLYTSTGQTSDARDAARLEFMVHRGANIDCCKVKASEPTVYRVTAFGGILTDWCPSYRDAIDAAMEQPR